MTTTLGSYELGELLGRGAMGAVHRATRTGSGDQIAVKVLRPELAADPELIARFVQERSVLCGLTHPNLVRVHDLVVEGGCAAIVMDLVDGSDLRQLLNQQGTLPPSDAARLVIELLSALTAVHASGIVHRDIKPENVLVGSDGGVRLTDFGIARLAHGPSLTRMSGLIGTPEYLAPELAEREHATPAADVYATGIVLYELLTGFTPFSGGHPVAVLRRHIDEDPPRPAGIPDALWDLLAAMLAKDPTARPTAAEAAQRLTTMAPALHGLPALPPARPHRDSEESPTSITHRGIDRQEQPTILRSKRSSPSASLKGQTRRRRIAAVAVAVVVLATALAAVAVSLGGSASAHPAATFAFRPQSYPSGLIVDRTWTLSGQSGSQLHGTATLTDGATMAIHGPFDEVIPKSVASAVGNVTLIPTPDHIVNADPVVRYDLNLGSGSSVKITYYTDVGKTTGSWSSRLARLASDQNAAQVAYLQSSKQAVPATLATLTVAPSSLSLAVGQTQPVTLSGTMSDRTPASTAALDGAAWNSTDPTVASVTNATITGLSPGNTTIRAQAGSLTATLAVAVTEPTTSSSVGDTTGAPTPILGSPGTSGSASPGTNTTSTPAPHPATPTTTATTSPPPPLVISHQPQPSATVLLRATLTLSVGVSGGRGPYNFQWYQDGIPIPGPGSLLVAGPFDLRSVGLYTTVFDVRVTDQAGQQATSSNSVVKVVGNPDINGDGVVNCADFDILKAAYGSAAGTANWNPAADLNGDGFVNAVDLSIFASHWTAGQPSPC